MNNREVMQQALEALDQLTDAVDGTGFSTYWPSFTFALDTIDALRAALVEPVQEPVAEKVLRESLRWAEWQDKHIYPCDGETYQNWKLTVYLPVPESEPDKSPEAALERMRTRAVEQAHGIGEQE